LTPASRKLFHFRKDRVKQVAIAAVHNTRQARVLEGYDSVTIAVEAARGVIADAGVRVEDIDGIFGQFSAELTYMLGVGPVWSPSVMASWPVAVSHSLTVVSSPPDARRRPSGDQRRCE